MLIKLGADGLEHGCILILYKVLLWGRFGAIPPFFVALPVTLVSRHIAAFSPFQDLDFIFCDCGLFCIFLGGVVDDQVAR